MSPDEPAHAEPLDDIGQPLRNTALVEAMRNVSQHDSPETRSLLFQLLLETSLLAVTPDAPDRPAAWTARADEPLSLVTLADAEGTVLPLFTSAAAVTRWRPDGAGFVALPVTAMLEMATANGTNKIALDLGSATSGYLSRHEIEQLARGRIPLGSTDVVAEGTSLRVGRAATPPSPDTLRCGRLRSTACATRRRSSRRRGSRR